MKMRNKLSILMLVVVSIGQAQIQDYNYKRLITGQTDQWHSLELPDSIFSKIAYDASDIRIYGITSSNDTVEAPYVYKVAKVNPDQEVSARILNASKNAEGYFYTLVLPAKATINELNLSFKKTNFDWRIKVAGSHDQKTWFTLLDDYRILSIDNDLTQFSFTKVVFPDASFTYFRIQIPTKVKPELLDAQLTYKKASEVTLKSFQNKEFKVFNGPKKKQTIIQVDLGLLVPVSQIRVVANETFDYYRPLEISYLSDSMKSETGWKYESRPLSYGMLNSIEPNIFQFGSTVLRRLTIRIDNHDNQPLTISSVEVSGYRHFLVARFTTPATYYLSYGNPSKVPPTYDISAVTIPDNLIPLRLGQEEVVAAKSAERVTPLFENKLWLWGIMALIIGVLGFATLKMISKKEG